MGLIPAVIELQFDDSLIVDPAKNVFGRIVTSSPPPPGRILPESANPRGVLVVGKITNRACSELSFSQKSNSEATA